MTWRPLTLTLALGVVLTGSASLAHAETETPSPAPTGTATGSPAPTTSDDPFVLPFSGDVRDITFPEANIDGSLTQDGSVITLKSDVFFAYNKANLNAKAAVALDQAAARLRDLGATKVRVAGFTDSLGSASYNKGLSLRRAEAVRTGLAGRVPGLAFEVKGYGEAKPVATNKSADGRAVNRRVTITVVG